MKWVIRNQLIQLNVLSTFESRLYHSRKDPLNWDTTSGSTGYIYQFNCRAQETTKPDEQLGPLYQCTCPTTHPSSLALACSLHPLLPTPYTSRYHAPGYGDPLISCAYPTGPTITGGAWLVILIQKCRYKENVCSSSQRPTKHNKTEG